MKASGLDYSLHSAGTTVGMGHISSSNSLFFLLSLSRVAFRCMIAGILPAMKPANLIHYCDHFLTMQPTEGSWDDVMRLIGQAHTLVHQNGILRVQTDIRIGTRYTFNWFAVSQFHQTNGNSAERTRSSITLRRSQKLRAYWPLMERLQSRRSWSLNQQRRRESNPALQSSNNH